MQVMSTDFVQSDIYIIDFDIPLENLSSLL